METWRATVNTAHKTQSSINSNESSRLASLIGEATQISNENMRIIRSAIKVWGSFCRAEGETMVRWVYRSGDDVAAQVEDTKW